MSYEKSRENKQRRTKLPTKEARQVLAGDPAYRRVLAILGSSLRYGYTLIKLVIRKVNERRDMISIFIYTLGFFVSGFFAAKGMRFESLLSAVCALVASATLMGVRR